jgi:CubicO group peptidase (beta-lactamase class C family)
MRLIATLLAMIAVSSAAASPVAAWGMARPQPVGPNQASALAEFDAFLQAFRKKNSIPALTAVIVSDGAVLWQKAYGFSDDEGEIAATIDTTFSIASVTKPIAATAILREVEAGRTSLDVPMTADHDWPDTCQWLASSSIPFGSGGKDAHGAAIPKVDCGRKLTLRDILNMRVNGPRGSGFVYNPISFARIDRMIEGAGGRPLRRIVRENVIVPAGMQDVALGWRDPDGGAALRLLAFPFIVKDGKPAVNALGDDDFRAAGGIKASALQIARFDLALDSGRLLSPAWQKRVMGGDLPGELGDYRWGWFVQDWKGRRLMWHSGWDEGRYSAIYLKVPDRRVTLVVLANTEALWWGNSLVRAEIDQSPIASRFLDLFVSH